MERDSGIVNGDSGETLKAFTINQNECSRSPGIGVHVEPEWVFRMGRNMHSANVLMLLKRKLALQAH